MGTKRYPLSPPEPDNTGSNEDPQTLASDWLYIHRHRLVDDNKASGNYQYSRKNTISGPKKVNYDSECCYIALPGNIQTSYGPAYRRMDIGGSGVALADLLGGGMNMSDLAEKLQDAAQVALPEFSTATAISLANNFNAFLGLQGNVDINSLQQMNHGKIFNPFSEQIFSGVAFRTHSFAFKMFARDEREASEIYDIIEYIKQGAMPGIDGGDFPETLVNKNKTYEKANGKQNKKGKEIEYDDLEYKRKEGNVFDETIFKTMNKNSYAKSDRYMTVPDLFDLRFVRMPYTEGQNPRDVVKPGSSQTPSGRNSNRKELHFKIHPSVCTGVQVNYTPDSTYVARKRVGQEELHVPAVVLSCSFLETRLITRRDVRDGY